MKQEYLECGKIINTHGVDGAVKIESYCDSPEILASLGSVYLKQNGEYRKLNVTSASVFKRFVFASFEGTDSFDTAEALKNKIVYAYRGDIPVGEGDHLIADLIGLDVTDDVTGRVYGKLKGVMNNGASDIYEIETPDGERLMPAVDEFVKRIDTEKGIFITPIEGMFD